MKTNTLSALLGAARRECRRMLSRRLYLVVCVALPLFCLLFMATIFGSGQMERLPIAVVDADNSSASREVVRRLSATPAFHIVDMPADEIEARTLMQRMDIYGYLVIPHGFGRKMVTGDAVLNYYYHYALLSVGGTLMAAFERTLTEVSLTPIVIEAEALGESGEAMQSFLLPVEADVHPLYNPDLNYSVYLCQPMFFILLQILVLLTTVYVLGIEQKQHTVGEWLASARGDTCCAVLGKLLPYTFIYSMMAWAANAVFFGVMQIPFEGSWALLGSVTLLFIVATQSLAVAIFSLFPRMAYVMSFVSMIGSLGATLSGVTFPVAAMYHPVQLAAFLFPVRHFTEIVQSMVYFDAGFPFVARSIAFLLFFPLFALLLLPLLRRGLNKSLKPEENTLKPKTPDSYLSAVRGEWRAITTNPALLMVLAGGVFLYGLLYNYMYAPNLVRDVPLAVADLSHSALSREYVRLLDATPQVEVSLRTPDMAEARLRMKQGEVSGILYLPADFDVCVSRGETSPFLLYAATDAFLNYKGVDEATTRSMLALNERHREDGVAFLSPGGVVAAAYARPVGVVGEALYNVTEGYGSYLIPAVLIVILFQTMMMVVASLRGAENERRVGESVLVPRGNLLGVVAGRTTVHLLLYAVFACFLIGFLPCVFSIPHWGDGWSIAALLLPFLLATSLLAQLLARWFSDSEAPLLVITFFSVGYIFLSGVSYPLELMPWPWRLAHSLLPAPPAVLGFVKLNSMNATLPDVQWQVLTLWCQVLVFGVWITMNARRRQGS